MKPVLHILVGIPASGKSTLRQKLGYEEKIELIFSLDDYVEEKALGEGKTYSEVFQKYANEGSASLVEKRFDAIHNKKSAIWDQTNLSVRKRKGVIEEFKDTHFVHVHSIMLPERTHIDDWKELAYRLKSRPRKEIPVDVITNMVDSYVLPSMSEGMDKITFYNIWGVKIDVHV